MRAWPAWVAVAAALMGVLGCRQAQPVVRPMQPVERGPAPGYAEAAAGYNARVAPLERLWVLINGSKLRYVDREGERREEQGDGVCQYVRPSMVLVTLRKYGQVGMLLGSDEQRYWWIDVQNRPYRAYVGRHEHATAERIEATGLKVHPLDFVDLLGLTALPAAGGETAWAADGSGLEVKVAGRDGSGVRRLVLDPKTWDPVRIEVLDGAGRVLASSMLSDFARVSVRGAGPDTPRPRVPLKVTLDVDGGSTQVMLNLDQPQDDPSRLRARVFDFEKLVEGYGVEEVIDLDRRPE
ncbi:MAG: hypothetical protein KF678_09425 [Phycisphaeraceae bacterium]|nr:hypothetical protein [Phycisphaeraceae bacterium]